MHHNLHGPKQALPDAIIITNYRAHTSLNTFSSGGIVKMFSAETRLTNNFLSEP